MTYFLLQACLCYSRTMIAVLSTRMVPYMKQPLIVFMSHMAGTDPGFQVRRGVFRVKNHDFTPKNHIFSNFRGFARPWIRPCMNLQSYFYRVQVLYSHSRKNYLVLTVNARLLRFQFITNWTKQMIVSYYGHLVNSQNTPCVVAIITTYTISVYYN